VAFDLLWLNGADLRGLPLTERRRHLQNIMPKGSAIVCEPVSVTGRGHKLFELMCAHDLEGIVAKRLKDPYGPGARWLKIKNPGYSQNEGRRELFDRAVRSAPARGAFHVGS
jgi:bifunctional non-homologous end joining protein LigD